MKSQVNTDSVIRLYPTPPRELALQGLFLQPRAGSALNSRPVPLVYTSFIASLDGRIAIEQPVTGERGVPQSITNPRDWRLYQELAARADILLVSARFLRELARGAAQAGLPLSDGPAFADLKAWREEQGLSPQPAVVVLSASLELPLAELRPGLKHRLYVATGRQADPGAVKDIERHGATVIYAGEGRAVDGERLVARLAAEGYANIYSIAGPAVLETLLRSGVLNRIYLTQVHRLLGGMSYDTLLEGNLLTPPADFRLRALYYDDHQGETCGQFFGIYELTACGPQRP